ncbi:MAG: NUDIX hydrolase [Gammaproteobacteria bacterium]|nr:NUDIX hydrolase [Gammaproteobacteria bacterium]
MARPETPLLTTDIIICLDGDTRKVVMIERRHAPHGWALPGGFVDVGETLEAAAIREAKEETGLDVILKHLLGCYSDPLRDDRGHSVSAVYVARASGAPEAADDAKSVKVIDPADRALELAFDHRLILDDFLRYRDTGEVAPLRVPPG